MGSGKCLLSFNVPKPQHEVKVTSRLKYLLNSNMGKSKGWSTRTEVFNFDFPTPCDPHPVITLRD